MHFSRSVLIGLFRTVIAGQIIFVKKFLNLGLFFQERSFNQNFTESLEFEVHLHYRLFKSKKAPTQTRLQFHNTPVYKCMTSTENHDT